MTAYLTWLVDGLRYLIRLARHAPREHLPAIIDGLGGMVELLTRYQIEHAPINRGQLDRYNELRRTLERTLREAGHSDKERTPQYLMALHDIAQRWECQVISDGL